MELTADEVSLLARQAGGAPGRYVGGRLLDITPAGQAILANPGWQDNPEPVPDEITVYQAIEELDARGKLPALIAYFNAVPGDMLKMLGASVLRRSDPRLPALAVQLGIDLDDFFRAAKKWP